MTGEPTRRLVDRLPTLSRLAEFDALALSAAIWFLAKFLRYAFPPLFGTLQSTYGVSNTVVGAAFTGLMMAYAAMQFPSGALADRFGMVRVIAGGAVLAGAASLLAAAADPFFLLVVAMVLIGAGTGAHKTVAVGLMAAIYPDRTGRALGILDTFGALSGAAASAAVVAVRGAPGWRAVYVAGGAAGLLLAFLFVRRVPRHLSGSVPDGNASDGATETDGDDGPDTNTDANVNADDRPPADGSSDGVRRYLALFRDRRFATFVAVTVLFSFVYNGTVSFLPLYLTDYAGLSQTFANVVYSGLFVVALVQLVTGDLSDRVGRLPVMAAMVGLACVGLAVVVTASSPLVLAGAVLAFGAGGHGYRPVRGSYLVAVIPDEVGGGTLGIVRTFSMVAGAGSPAVVGFVSDAVGFGVAFEMLVAVTLAAFALLAVLVAFPRDE